MQAQQQRQLVSPRDNTHQQLQVLAQGYIYKQQKKEYDMKKYWYKLVGTILYRYGEKNDTKPREEKDLTGIFIRDYLEPKVLDGSEYFCFYLTFSDKRSIFSFTDRSEKDKWVAAIRQATGNFSIEDKYIIGQEIGRGKYGKVYQAQSKETGETLAIKVIAKRDRSKNDLEMFRHEVECLAECNQNNILRIVDHLETHEGIYIVMECLVGEDLDSFLQKQDYEISEELALRIFGQLVNGVAHLH